jgi:hypothetical protein
MSGWHGDEFFEGVRSKLTAGVGAGGELVADKMRESISVSGPPRSSPGEPPHVDSGVLLASIQVVGPAVQGDVIVAAVGSDVPYSVYLEYGTSRMAARPFMSRSIYDNQTEIGERVLEGLMLALTNAIYTKFTGTTALTNAFTGGMYPERAAEGTSMPYVVTTLVSAPTHVAYGNAHQLDDVIIRFVAVGIGHDATGALIETLMGVYDNTILTLSSGTMFDATRVGAPTRFLEPSVDGGGQEIWRWSVVYKYSVRN